MPLKERDGDATFDVQDLKSVGGLPLLLELESPAASAESWAARHAHSATRILDRHGALLIRGLGISGSFEFGRLLHMLFGSPLVEYRYRSTPRTALRGNVYTATEYPSTEVIQLHNESSYARRWPARIGFMCVQPARVGGATPIAESRRVYECLPPALRRRFESKGVMYVRNYSMIDLPWQTVFQTQDRMAVEAYCSENGIAYSWRADGTLRTSQVNPASVIDPVSGAAVWFNQAHLFHVTNLPADAIRTFVATIGEENLPRNAYYGDGSAIEVDTIHAIRTAYAEAALRFEWKQGDVLLLNNMLYAHGREAFTGARTVLTGMAAMCSFAPGSAPAMPSQ